MIYPQKTWVSECGCPIGQFFEKDFRQPRTVSKHPGCLPASQRDAGIWYRYQGRKGIGYVHVMPCYTDRVKKPISTKFVNVEYYLFTPETMDRLLSRNGGCGNEW